MLKILINIKKINIKLKSEYLRHFNTNKWYFYRSFDIERLLLKHIYIIIWLLVDFLLSKLN